MKDLVTHNQNGMFGPIFKTNCPVSQGKKIRLKELFGKDRINVGRIFQDIAKSHSKSMAVLSFEKSLTYEEIDQLSNALAFKLSINGVNASSRVLIRLSIDYRFVVSILAVAKIGATYIPINLSEPASRIEYFIRNSDATTIICDSSEDSDSLSDIIDSLTIIDPAVSNTDEKNYSCLQCADDIYNKAKHNTPIYIMYTSGTTGIPKGVQISHESLLNFLVWQKDILDFNQHGIMLQHSPYSFDFSIPEFWLPLITGGAIAIPPRAYNKHPIKLMEFMDNMGITVAQFVPKILDEFLIANKETLHQSLKKLKHVVTNGEPLKDNTRRTFYKYFPHAILHNNYGPTEATVAVTNYNCPKDNNCMPMYIGAAAYNTRIYITNENLESVGPGEIGEICIAGRQLSTGYLNNTDITSQKFVFSKHFGETIYRTGDLAEFTSRGNIKIYGRSDDQFKIRGMLVQPLGIENILEEQPGILRAVVKKQKYIQNRTRTRELILAYIQLKKAIKNQSFFIDRLKKRLVNLLMPHEIPTQFCLVKDFPKNKNGKIDRNSLPFVPAMESRGFNQIDSTVPFTKTEKQIFNVFQQLFDMQIGRYTSLEDTNLDSLDIVRLISEASKKGLVLPIDMIKDKSMMIHQLAEASTTRKIHSSSSYNRNSGSDIPKKIGDAFNWAIQNDQKSSVVLFHISLPDLNLTSRTQIRECFLKEFQKILKYGITFAIPAFTFSFIRNRCYNYKKTKSETGLLPMWLLDALPVVRTQNPVYSFVTGGPLAEELSNCTNSTPFGDDSYFRWFEKNNAKIVTFGTYEMTQTHRAEYLANVPYHKYFNISGIGDYGNGSIPTAVSVYARDIDSLPMMSQLAQDVNKTIKILGKSFQKKGLFGTSINYTFCEDLNKKLIPELTKDPYCMLKYKSFVKNYCSTDKFKNLRFQ